MLFIVFIILSVIDVRGFLSLLEVVLERVIHLVRTEVFCSRSVT